MKHFSEKAKALFSVGGTMLTTASVWLMDPSMALAGGLLQDNIEQLGNKDSGLSGSNALDNLQNTTKGLGQAGFSFALTFAFIIFGIGIVVAFAYLFWAKANEREEAKKDIVWKFIAIIGVSGALALISGLSGIGKSIKF